MEESDDLFSKSGVIFANLTAAFIFLSLATYSRVETALGTVIPDKGISTILPTRTGTVVELAVTEGQLVEVGDLLALIPLSTERQVQANKLIKLSPLNGDLISFRRKQTLLNLKNIKKVRFTFIKP